MLKRRTDEVIDELVAATCGLHAGARQRHVYAQALHGLVRLAKVEQLLEMRLDAERATGAGGAAAEPGRQRQIRAMLRKIGMDVKHCQRELAFGQHGTKGRGG